MCVRSSVTYYYVAECHQQPSSRDWLVDWLLVFLHPCGWPGVQGGGCVDMGSFFFVFVPGAGCWVLGSGWRVLGAGLFYAVLFTIIDTHYSVSQKKSLPQLPQLLQPRLRHSTQKQTVILH